MTSASILATTVSARPIAGPIECVFAVDDGYSQHLAVALLSLAENNRRNAVHITVVSRGISDANKARLLAMLSGFDTISLDYYALDPALVDHLPTKIHLTVETYFRLFLPTILPDIDRVLYLDADLVVLGDLMPLWTIDMKGKAVAAVREPFGDTNERLSLPLDNPAFNAGVLLMDLDVWRRDDLQAKCLQYVAENEEKLVYCDQDALNAVLMGNVAFAPYEFNFHSRTDPADIADLGLSKADYERLDRDPKIVHYSSPRKPWRYRDDAPREQYYTRYLRRTPWAKTGQPDRNIEQMIRRHLGPRLGPGLRRVLNAVMRRTPGSS